MFLKLSIYSKQYLSTFSYMLVIYWDIWYLLCVKFIFLAKMIFSKEKEQIRDMGTRISDTFIRVKISYIKVSTMLWAHPCHDVMMCWTYNLSEWFAWKLGDHVEKVSPRRGEPSTMTWWCIFGILFKWVLGLISRDDVIDCFYLRLRAIKTFWETLGKKGINWRSRMKEIQRRQTS